MPGADPPDAVIERELGATWAGTGMWGGVYLAPERRRCYRLILADHLTADRRADLREWRTRARMPGVAPFADDDNGPDQQEFGGRWYDVVTYELTVEGTLEKAVAAPDPARRIAAVARVLREVPGWWRRAEGLMPAACDIAFSRGHPQLLALPPWGTPPIEAMFDDPRRIAYLAPEAARGQGPIDRAADIFTLGITALRCFVSLPVDEPDRLLHLAAAAAVHAPENCESRLPFWMDRVGSIQETVALLRRLLSMSPPERRQVDPVAIADELDRCRASMDPLTAVRRLREDHRPEEALDLAHSIMLSEPSYDLLLVAAEIAYQDLNAPLDALTLLEQAVRSEPDRTEAYAAQFSLIGRFRRHIMERLSDAIDTSFAERLDAIMEGAFDRLPPDAQGSHAHDMARYLIEQQQPERANRFAYTWLNEGGTLHWWRFDLMLDYAETFLRLDDHDTAERLATEVRQGIQRVRANGSMPDWQIQRHHDRLVDFDRWLRGHREGTP